MGFLRAVELPMISYNGMIQAESADAQQLLLSLP